MEIFSIEDVAIVGMILYTCQLVISLVYVPPAKQ